MGGNDLSANNGTDPFSNWPEELCIRLQRSPIALFVGSGISVDPPSFLPDGNTLKCDLFSAITGGAHVPAHLLESVTRVISDYRPELFLDLVHEWGGVDWRQLIDFMLDASPNMNHMCIAHLSRCGKLDMVVTTNFDCLIENALTAEGVQFKAHCTLEEFDSWHETGNVCLAKLHGSLMNSSGMPALDSLLGTLKEVGHLLPEGKANLLKHVLSKFTVIFLGYSGRDDFDIFPILLSVEQPDIIWVTHSEDHLPPWFESSEEIRAREGRDHIDKIVAGSDACYRVTCHTGSFLAQLCNLVIGSAPESPAEHLPSERRMPERINPRKSPLSLVGLFLWHGRQWEDAVEALQLAFREAACTAIPFYRSELQRGIGISQKGLGHLEQSRQALFRARDLCEADYSLLRESPETKFHQTYFRMMSQISEDIGLTFLASGDHDNSINWIENAQEWSMRLVFPRQAQFLARNLGNLGIAYKAKAISTLSPDDFSKSSELLEVAIRSEAATGNIYGQVLYLHHASELCLHLSIWDRALDLGCRCVSLMELLSARFPEYLSKFTVLFIFLALCGLAKNVAEAEAILGNHRDLGKDYKNKLLRLYRVAMAEHLIFAGDDPQRGSIGCLFDLVSNSFSWRPDRTVWGCP